MMAALVVVAACGSTAPSPSPSPTAADMGNALTLGPVGPNDIATLDEAYQSHLDGVHTLRDAAGLVNALGPAGPAIYASIDASEAAFLGQYLQEMTGSTGLTGQLAAAFGPTEDDRPLGSMEASISSVSAMGFAGLLAGFKVGYSNQTTKIPGGVYAFPTKTSKPFTSTENGVTTSTVLTEDTTYRDDGGQKAVTVKVASETTVTDDAVGKVPTKLHGSDTVTIEFQGCPDSNGLITGRVRMSNQQASGDPGSGGSVAKYTSESNYHLYVGEDAWAVRQEEAHATDVSIRGSLSMIGQAPDARNDFDARIGYTSYDVRTAAGTDGERGWMTDGTKTPESSLSTDFRVVANQQYADGIIKTFALIGAAMAGITTSLLHVEEYWRSGGCVEVAVLEGKGGDVDPGQQVQVIAQPRHKIDHVDLKKPVVAAFSGKSSAEPVGVAVPAPARFNYTAGDEEHDQGTVTLTSTSNRGIGTTSVTFRVPTQETPSPSPDASPTRRPATPPTSAPQPTPAAEEGPTIHGIITAQGTYDVSQYSLSIDMDFAWATGTGATELTVKSGTYTVSASNTGLCAGSGSDSGLMTRGKVRSALNDRGTVEVRFNAGSTDAMNVEVHAQITDYVACSQSIYQRIYLVAVFDCEIPPADSTTFAGTCEDSLGGKWTMRFERR